MPTNIMFIASIMGIIGGCLYVLVSCYRIMRRTLGRRKQKPLPRVQLDNICHELGLKRKQLPHVLQDYITSKLTEGIPPDKDKTTQPEQPQPSGINAAAAPAIQGAESGKSDQPQSIKEKITATAPAGITHSDSEQSVIDAGHQERKKHSNSDNTPEWLKNPDTAAPPKGKPATINKDFERAVQEMEAANKTQKTKSVAASPADIIISKTHRQGNKTIAAAQTSAGITHSMSDKRVGAAAPASGKTHQQSEQTIKGVSDNGKTDTSIITISGIQPGGSAGEITVRRL